MCVTVLAAHRNTVRACYSAVWRLSRVGWYVGITLYLKWLIQAKNKAYEIQDIWQYVVSYVCHKSTSEIFFSVLARA